MPELQQFEKQDLINLQKVLNLDKSTQAAYTGKDGKVYSMHQNQQKGYRLQLNGSDTIHLFIFDEKNKFVEHLKYSADLEAGEVPRPIN